MAQPRPGSIADEDLANFDTVPLVQRPNSIYSEARTGYSISGNQDADTKSGAKMYLAERNYSISSPYQLIDVKGYDGESTEAKPRPFNIWTWMFRPFTRRRRRSRFEGWRMGVFIGCITSSLVLLSNLAILIRGAVNGYDSDGVATLYIGDSMSATRVNTLFHVLINVLSTLLLSASNYTMQVLSAPTREDIDKAHAKGQYLDIGRLSFRNLCALPRRRAWLFTVLSLSSIPLHLFYNAAIFKSLAGNEWKLNLIDIRSNEASNYTRYDYTNYENQTSVPNSPYLQLDNDMWSQWNNYLLGPEQGDLFIIVDRIGLDLGQSLNETVSPEDLRRDWVVDNMSNLINNLTYQSTSAQWIRLEGNIAPENTGNVSLHVNSVFTTPGPRRSSVQISLYFLIVVVALNTGKLCIMAWVVTTDRSVYLVTMGDAAASFLKRPDPNTEGKCMLGFEEFLVTAGAQPFSPVSTMEEAKTLFMRSNGTWLPRPQRYLFSINRNGKILYTLLTLAFAMVVIFSPMYSSTQPYKGEDEDNLTWSWGTLSNDYLPIGTHVSNSRQTLLSACVANVPQLLLSFAYLNINAICTSMAGAWEWNKFAVRRKYLRVTNPLGQQRSTYFLTLPYRWSIPLIAMGGLLHWNLSQAFFVARADYYYYNGTRNDGYLGTEIGFSSLSYFVFGVNGFIQMLIIGFFGFRKFQTKMPFAGSCSLAISAACHPARDEVDPELEPVQWGVIDMGKEKSGAKMDEPYEHCSLSSLPTEEPLYGQVYH